MRADASTIDTKKASDGCRSASRAAQLRQNRLRALSLESLEARTLLSTLPKVAMNGSPTQFSLDSTGNESSPTIVVDPASDSGRLNNDDYTFDNNSADHPAPVFDVSGILPGATVVLVRDGVVVGMAVNIQIAPGLYTVQVADTNGGKGVIPDSPVGIPIDTAPPAGNPYHYTAYQIDTFNVASGQSAPLLLVIVASTAPTTPTSLKLDPASDTGTFNNDQVTKDNNSAAYGPPYFDVSGVEADASVQLYRAPVINGVVGTAVLVNTLVNVPGGGALLIPDTNAGNGVIPDGTYQYSAMQVDLAGNISPFTNSVTVIINTAKPTPEPAPTPVLDPLSDSGTFNNDKITQDNNGNPYPAPVFDVGRTLSPIAATETVELFRAPVINGVTGASILVNTLTNVKAGIIQIPDINAGNGRIADGAYIYTIQLITLSGVPGTVSSGLRVIIDATVPVTPSPFRLDAGSDTGVSNSDGITLRQFPIFDVGSVEAGATVNLYRNGVIVNTLTNQAGGTVLITDPNQIPDGTYTYTVGQVDLSGNIGALSAPIIVTYDTAQPSTPSTPVLDSNSDTGIKGDNITSNVTPFFDVNVALSGFEANSSLSLVRDGTVIASTPYNVTNGTIRIQDLGPVPFGVHTYQAFLTDRAGNVSALGGPLKVTFANNAAGTLVLDPGSDSGVKGDNITNVTSPSFDVSSLPANETLRLLRNGVVINSLPTGGGGLLTISEPSLLSSGTYTYTAVLVTALGVASPPGPPLIITIDTLTPTTPTNLKLDPASDTGVKGDSLTSVTNPTIDISSILPGATVKLLRNGSVVAIVTSAAGGTVAVIDPGPLFRGSYTYTALQVSVAGNTSLTSTSVTVTIDTSVPPAPTLALDSSSDTGAKGDSTTSVTNPFLDVSGVVAGATVTLFRNGVSIATLTSAAAGTIKIQDPGPLALGAYTYTAQQSSLAGVVGAVGSPLTITIVAPSTTPKVPTLTLAPGSDTGVKGDGITSAHTLTFTGVADPGVTVNLYSASGTLLGTATASPGGAYSITLYTNLLNGTYSYQAEAVNSLSVSSGKSTPALQVKVVTIDGDYTNSGKASFALFRRTNPTVGTWFVKGLPALNNFNFGAGSLDVPMTADFNGDGLNDPTLYRPSTGQWFAALSGSATYPNKLLVTFGGPNDIPVPADYNGTGVSLESVFRPSTGQWFFYNRGGGHNITSPVTFPINSKPEPGDYDGVGVAEIAVYNPTNSQWLVVSPGATSSHLLASYGGPNDIPVPGQYDNIALAGTGKAEVTEPAVWRPSTGQYFIHGANGNRTITFAPGDIPVPGDWDGIGQTEPAVYRPSTGQWLVEGPGDTSPRVLATFGGPNDIPLLSPYPYRALTLSSVITSASIRGGSPGTGSGSGGAAAFDFGVSSLGMTKGSNVSGLGSTGSSSTSGSSNATSPPPAASPFTVIPTTRPRQEHVNHKTHEPSKKEHANKHPVKAKTSVIHKALHTLASLSRLKGHGAKRG